jgi:F-type H+-transporting ATPase subunit gamma
MANLKEIRNRIASVKSTRQITSAMKMVAASKLRKAQDAILDLRPYSDKLQEILENVGSSTNLSDDNPYVQQREIKRVLIFPVTSNKGLCGGFNMNIVKATMQRLEEKYAHLAENGKVDVYALGRKGADVLQKRGVKLFNKDIELMDKLEYEKALPIINHAMQQFTEGTYDVVEIIYNQFKNAGTQLVVHEQFLPIQPSEEETDSHVQYDYIFEPTKHEIVEELMPKSLKVQFYRCLLDSVTSEHGARMTAMHQATDNATEMIKDLTLSYNKARQAAITNELIEIVSGANALEE